MRFFLKDPQSRLDYQLDWGDRYLADAVLAQSHWSVQPVHDSGIAIDASSHDLLVSQVIISGGEAGRVYDLTNRVTLDNGVVDERTLTIRVEVR